jgi:hypothetical protein
MPDPTWARRLATGPRVGPPTLSSSLPGPELSKGRASTSSGRIDAGVGPREIDLPRVDGVRTHDSVEEQHAGAVVDLML